MWPNNRVEWLLLVRPQCFAQQMVTVFGEALRYISAILKTCVREAFSLMGQLMDGILIGHSKTTKDFFFF